MKTESILKEVMEFYDINGKELFFLQDDEDKKLMHIKKVTATLLKEVGKVSLKEICNLFGESLVETRRKYLQGIDRKVLKDLNELSLSIRNKNAIKNSVRETRVKKNKKK